MKISDEAVQGAARALCRFGTGFSTIEATNSWVDEKWPRFKEEATLALTAALPFLQGVKVKALDWENSNPDRNDIWACLTDDDFEINRWWEDGNSYFEIGKNIDVRHDTIEAAKAAAQADYEARILSAIEVAPSPRAQALEEAAQVADARKPLYTELQAKNACAEIASSIRALSSQTVADGWLPIETAPKDGTQILIEVHPGIFDVVCWSDNAWREGGNFMRLRKEPTHWRPLPASPGASDTRPTGGCNHGE